MSTKVSIVIPVYNIESFVKDCLMSVIKQTYKNIEILVINDGSTDDSLRICLDFMKNDKRIIVFNKKNGGLSDARNFGIKKATGRAIFLLDGDDVISNDCIEKLVEAFESQKAKIVTSKYRKIISTSDNIISKKPAIYHVYSKKDALETLLYQDGCTTSAWGKLYDRKLFENIHYPKGKLHEDLPVTYRLFYKANRVVMIDNELYGYRIRQGSITNTKYSKARSVSMDFAHEETAFIAKHMPQLINAAYNREFMESIYTIISIGEDKHYNEEKKRAISIIKKYRRVVIFDRKSTRITRRFALLSILGPSAITVATKLREKVRRWK